VLNICRAYGSLEDTDDDDDDDDDEDNTTMMTIQTQVSKCM
jgi:hypothetical protein